MNITDRLNQPAWRDDPTLLNTGPAASPDFARSANPPVGAPMVPYAAFAAARSLACCEPAPPVSMVDQTSLPAPG